MKKLANILIIALFVIPGTTNAAFYDVDGNTQYENSIIELNNQGVIDGYPDGSFRPDECVNRVEFLKMLYTALNVDIYGYGTVGFSDTDPFAWYAPYLNAGKKRGAVQGYPDGSFKPANCVNRAEAIKMAVIEFDVLQPEDRLSQPGDNGYFYDVRYDQWYANYIYSATDYGYVGLEHVQYEWLGGLIKFFLPGEPMTRKEVAQMIYNMQPQIYPFAE